MFQDPRTARHGLALIVFDVLLIGVKNEECIDHIAESGAQSTCTSGPAPGAGFLLIVSLLTDDLLHDSPLSIPSQGTGLQ